MKPWLPLTLLAAACGTHHPATTFTDAGGVHGQLLTATNLSHNHLATCDDPNCGNGANPPLGGDHCATWLNCRVWTTPQPKCNWIHNLEHGAIVIAYNCSNCDALVQQLAQYQSAHMDALVTPDPELPNTVAVMVWGFGWLGDGFDPAAFDEVVSHQFQASPENVPCQP